MNWKLVRLNFGRNTVHFGEVGIGIEKTSDRVRSDTLFSAWISAYARLFGEEVSELLKRFQQSEPPVRLSSTFLYYRHPESSNYIYYLPRPLEVPRNYPQGNDLDFFKAYKKLTYLPLPVWRRWYQEDGFTNAESNSDRAEILDWTQKQNLNGQLTQAGTFDYGKTSHENLLPKVAVDRVTRATNFYHTGFTQYAWRLNGNEIESLSGLYFLLYFPHQDPVLENKLFAALNLLGEEGLGGERSSGAGRFAIEWLDLPSEWKKVIDYREGNSYCLISLFWSKSPPKELINTASYDLIERGGWIASPSGQQLRRKKVRMFAEGSVFSQSPKGELADVTPPEFGEKPEEYNPHPIYRSGISLSLPIHIEQPNQ